MRILHITFSLENSGKENMLVDIAEEQQKLGHKLAIVVVNDLVEENLVQRIPQSIRFWCLNRKPGSKNPIPFLKLFDILHRCFKPDVVHAHDVYLGKPLKKMFAKAVVLTIHGPGMDIGPMKYFDNLFAISNSVKFDVESRGFLPCNMIYNGIRTSEIFRRTSYKFDSEFKIVFVKRLNHQRKGQDLLIRAIKMLVKEKNCNPYNLKVYLVGDGESYGYLQKMIFKSNLSETVILLGNKNRDWIYANLCDYHLFVHPSRYEGFGLVVAEAMAAGIPIVSSAIEGPAEILANGKYGLLFENNDAKDLADKIEQAVKMYTEGTIKQLADHAYKHCVDNFDISITAANYCKYYLPDKNINQKKI